MSIADVAQKVAIEYGKRASYKEVYQIMSEVGLRDEDGSLASDVLDLVRNAIIRVKVNY